MVGGKFDMAVPAMTRVITPHERTRSVTFSNKSEWHPVVKWELVDDRFHGSRSLTMITQMYNPYTKVNTDVSKTYRFGMMSLTNKYLIERIYHLNTPDALETFAGRVDARFDPETGERNHPWGVIADLHVVVDDLIFNTQSPEEIADYLPKKVDQELGVNLLNFSITERLWLGQFMGLYSKMPEPKEKNLNKLHERFLKVIDAEKYSELFGRLMQKYPGNLAITEAVQKSEKTIRFCLKSKKLLYQGCKMHQIFEQTQVFQEMILCLGYPQKKQPPAGEDVEKLYGWKGP
jgi:hypothetical protein